MFSSKEYSSFLKWNPDHAHSADSVAQPFVSLVSMVRDGYEFDEELVRKVSKFLSSVTSLFETNDSFDNFLNAIGQASPDRTEMSASHQPTLDFVCSSHIPIVFLSLLSTIEDEETHQLIIWLISDNIRKWNRYGAETMHRGRILLQTLEKEGFHEGIEQALLHDKSSEDGQNVRIYSYQLMKHLGMNSRLHH
ncbi:hypothetical protein BLNAU_15812 [Blattamonas nauphoetae]|uniref:Uncharacterized protein n=1 Tax=Blattamonas nauphoetae TaxID=2049346 RepID=A0ABQ9XEE2_9EUKA|nr:hypothetical protein BLNAU_15812 [Blattamonas nauphoetae]